MLFCIYFLHLTILKTMKLYHVFCLERPAASISPRICVRMFPIDEIRIPAGKERRRMWLDAAVVDTSAEYKCTVSIHLLLIDRIGTEGDLTNLTDRGNDCRFVRCVGL